MKKTFALLLSLMLVLCCTAGMAAENEIDGSVVSLQTRTVRAEAYGRVADVLVQPGQPVRAGDVLVTLETTKTYARESGTVHLFGSTGDTGEMLESRYGAVAYLEPDAAMRITDASSKYAVDTEENKTMHPGETVNLVAVVDANRTGTGFVTAVSGNTYTVEDVRGNLEQNEKVTIYRGETISDGEVTYLNVEDYLKKL